MLRAQHTFSSWTPLPMGRGRDWTACLRTHMEWGRPCCSATDWTTRGDNDGLAVVSVVGQAGLRHAHEEALPGGHTRETAPHPLVASEGPSTHQGDTGWRAGSGCSTCRTRGLCGQKRLPPMNLKGLFYWPTWLLVWPGETLGP